MKQTAMITNIQRFSIHDGEGIRTTVFFKGCPLRCSWCANPEAQIFENEVMHFKSKCKRCQRCIHACSDQSIIPDAEGFPKVMDPAAPSVGQRIEKCLYDAIRYAAKEYTPQELLAECEKDKPFYGEKGGVTLSGGECLMFESFCLPFMELLKGNGIRITIETCGAGKRETLLKYSAYTQRIYFDVKHHDPERFREIAGGDLKQILRNLHALTDVYENTCVRIPVIYGINDTREDMHRLAALIKETIGEKGIRFVELLPFHNLGETKYEALRKEYQFAGRTNMDKDTVRAWIPEFEKLGLPCIVN